MRNEFIPYKEALALKELGFDEPCFYMWNIDTKELFSSNSTDINGQPTNLDLIGNVDFTAPLYQQAFRWFRDTYGYQHSIDIDLSLENFFTIKHRDKGMIYESKETYKLYEEAELACLKKLIKIINKTRR